MAAPQTIAIFGTGSALKDLLSILPDHVAIAGLSDNDASRQGMVVEGYQVLHPVAFAALQVDRFVIAARAVDPIRAQLVELGVPADRISAYYPSYSGVLADKVNADIAVLNRDLGLAIPSAGIASMYVWPEQPGMEKSGPREDFVRRHAFRLAAERINANNVAGAVGELGVYQGEQAALLSRLFHDRPLHLFDTFQGFAEQDLGTEQSAGFSGAALGDFENTSVELVLGKIAQPERAHIHKGFFPDTTVGVEDRFAFVSLDVDLYEPTLAGLGWFYPRLSHGGCIFVHDYNNRRYLGVRNAVEAFLKESGACALPIPDFAGSIVVLK